MDSVDGRDGLAALVTIGPALAAGATGWGALLAEAGAAPDPAPGDPEQPAIIGYTSGTTGTPKGVVVTDRGLTRIVRHMPVHYGLRPGSRCAFTGTFSFVAGIWGVILPHLYLGGSCRSWPGWPRTPGSTGWWPSAPPSPTYPPRWRPPLSSRYAAAGGAGLAGRRACTRRRRCAPR